LPLRAASLDRGDHGTRVLVVKSRERDQSWSSPDKPEEDWRGVFR
jgi:hypothetical protein